MSMDFESVKSQYMKFPDKSDFVPVGADNGDIKFYYADDAGLQKAKFMSFSLGINPDYEYTEKRHILEILESFGGEVDDMAILRVKREEEFAPVKNADSAGVDCPKTARELYKEFHHLD